MTWVGGFREPEVSSHPDAAAAAAAVAAFAARGEADPARYARSLVFVFEGAVVPVAGDPPALVTATGPVVVPLPPRGTVPPAGGGGWRPPV